MLAVDHEGVLVTDQGVAIVIAVAVAVAVVVAIVIDKVKRVS